jgi:hypothetical protein
MPGYISVAMNPDGWFAPHMILNLLQDIIQNLLLDIIQNLLLDIVPSVVIDYRPFERQKSGWFNLLTATVNNLTMPH